MRTVRHVFIVFKDCSGCYVSGDTASPLFNLFPEYDFLTFEIQEMTVVDAVVWYNAARSVVLERLESALSTCPESRNAANRESAGVPYDSKAGAIRC